MALSPLAADVLQRVVLLILSAVLGGLIGWQREAQARPAGLRTHALVCLGSCLLTLVRLPGSDPARIAAQVVTGIGFIGAGVILRRGAAVRGLTTAASIWIVAGIGIAVGGGGANAGIAVVATGIALATLTLGKRLERYIRRTAREATLVLSVPRHKGVVGSVLSTLTASGAAILSFEEESAGLPDTVSGTNTGRRGLIVTIRLDSNTTPEALTEALAEALPEVQLVWT